MTYDQSNELALKVMGALGIDPAGVRRLELIFDVGHPADVIVYRNAPGVSNMEDLATQLAMSKAALRFVERMDKDERHQGAAVP